MDWEVFFFFNIHYINMAVISKMLHNVHNGEVTQKSHSSLKLSVNCSLVVENCDSDHFKKKRNFRKNLQLPKKHPLNSQNIHLMLKHKNQI